MKQSHLLSLLPLFTAPNVPAFGPEEEEIDPPRWRVSNDPTPAHYPGGGLSRHPMLYIGEGCNKIFLVNGGKVIWTYSTGTGWELDDVWMLNNGNILFSRMTWAGEVTPDKRLVWRTDAEPGEEIHSVQPIGPDKALVLRNAKTPRCQIVNKKTGAVEREYAVPYDPKFRVHDQNRRIRMTAQGTILVPCLAWHKVIEYDQDFGVIWSHDIPAPWAAIRLNNGNTLITNESERLTREVNPDGETVWEIRLSELPEEYRLPDSQSCVRLKNGNTILCSRGEDGTGPQLVEVTPDKEVVWVIRDWKHFGPATAVQILSDPGDPESPGDCQR